MKLCKNKEYPKIIVMRKGIVGVVIIGAMLLVMLILWNIYHATVKQKDNAGSVVQAKAVITKNPEVLWYKNQTAKKNNTITNSVDEQMAIPQPLADTAAKTDETHETLDDREYKKAKAAAISSNQISFNLSGNGTIAERNIPTQVETERDDIENKYSSHEADQNKQGEKIAFIKNSAASEKDYLAESLRDPMSQYEVKAGTIIPGILISGINSDLPGQIIGQVRSNVYDTVSGRYLLIPQGAKIIGLYDSQIVYGQERVLVIWKRIIFPNGKSIDLEGMPGADLSGYAGFSDQVNSHYGKMLGSVILLSVLSAGAELSQPDTSSNDSNDLSINQTLASSLGTNISDVATNMVNKNLNIQPTLEIRPGYFFNINVTKDIVFPGGYAE